ncbi:3-deoxy-manno-octulosonate cytidylyltransferase [Croceivirga lutea]|uniref:cytidylyltransferase domain-containing protein n=1 Tax=Croceivirga lutea TaxID=1775167 RepID=UPI001639DB87|nr:hypothetical protein [Croceivirga lutea]GGG38960.1 3-deoxy-manno-octulosonate cytidylyltransferase [Croceivirga lutea]
MIGIIVLCRYSSSRLPGKILKPLNGKPILQYIIERLEKLNHNIPVVICTSNEPSDDIIEDYCKTNNLEIFRGHLENVAQRFLDCSKAHNFSSSVRINGDNVFLDYELIKSMIITHQSSHSLFTSNVKNRTFPKGMSVEIVDVNYYQNSINYFKEEDKEHVMTYFYRKENKRHNFIYNSEDYGKTLNFAIDTPQDFNNASAVIELMKDSHVNYKMKEIIQLYNQVYEKK